MAWNWKVLDAKWFGVVGIVRVETEQKEILYYIGAGKGAHEEEDKQYIMDWGYKFPKEAGDRLFGVGPFLMYGEFAWSGDKKSLDFISALIKEKEAKQVRKSAQVDVPRAIPPVGGVDFLKALDALRKG